MKAKKIISKVGRCARCGKNHRAVVFKKFRRPLQFKSKEIPTHWGICPVTKEPILFWIG